MAMNNKTTTVFKGCLALSADERRELDAAIRNYQTGTSEIQKSLRETTVSLGPVGGGCPCCGR